MQPWHAEEACYGQAVECAESGVHDMGGMSTTLIIQQHQLSSGAAVSEWPHQHGHPTYQGKSRHRIHLGRSSSPPTPHPPFHTHKPLYLCPPRITLFLFSLFSLFSLSLSSLLLSSLSCRCCTCCSLIAHARSHPSPVVRLTHCLARLPTSTNKTNGTLIYNPSACLPCTRSSLATPMGVRHAVSSRQPSY